MAGNIHFGNHLDAQTVAIGHKILDLFLGIVAALDLIGTMGAKMVALAVCAHLMELGEYLGFHSPALVIGNMPVDGVELKERSYLRHFLQFANGQHMPGAVQMDGAEGIIRFILNGHGGNALGELELQLGQGISAPDQALVAAGLQGNFRSHGQHITFPGKRRINHLHQGGIAGHKTLSGGNGFGSRNQIPLHN